jgi:aryl-alcohol dehydrogenase-like predicted oxidoreductase
MSTSAALPELTGHDDADLLIGDVARLWGLSIDTLRYYDRAGLLGAVHRDGGDESRRTGCGTDVRPKAIRAECEASLRRLRLDAVDLYQLHGGAETVAAAEDVVATCEDLLAEGKIRSFGTAQDNAETVAVFARSDGCVAVQTQLNVFGWTAATLDAAHTHGWAVLARSPLAMGMMSGKYHTTNRPQAGDVRLDTPYWTTSTPTRCQAGCTAWTPYGSC